MTPLPDLRQTALEPVSGRATGLVVLLHGYGSTGAALMQASQLLAPSFPNLAFVAPDAPGQQWFSLSGVNPLQIRAGARQAAPLIDRLLDQERDRRGLRDDQIVLAGFSQGGIMALQVGLQRPRAPGGLVALAGFWPDERVAGRPPVTLIHGEEDPIVPAVAFHATQARLQAAGVPVRAHLIPGAGHWIGPEALRLVREALRAALPTG